MVKEQGKPTPATARSGSSKPSRTRAAPNTLPSNGFISGLTPKQNPNLQRLFAPVLESFNRALTIDLPLAVQELPPQEFEIGDRIVRDISCVPRYTSVTFGKPERRLGGNVLSSGPTTVPIFPSECREGGYTYSAPVTATLSAEILSAETGEVLDRSDEPIVLNMGDFPVMVKSKFCNLNGLSPTEFVKHGEESEEGGGTFIINGNERYIRMLIMGRRNFPLAINRATFALKGPGFSTFGVLIRSCKPDQTGVNSVLHYRLNGLVDLSVSIDRQAFFVPLALILKASKETTDREIWEKVIQQEYEDSFATSRAELLLQDFHLRFPELKTRSQCSAFLGKIFRSRLTVSRFATDFEAGEYLINNFVLPHCQTGPERFETLIFMVHKLYAIVRGKTVEDSSDTTMNQEILTPGQTYLAVVKDRLLDHFEHIELTRKKLKSRGSVVSSKDVMDAFKELLRKTPSNAGTRVTNFISTGNFNAKRTTGLSQSSGFSIVAEKVNFFRYLSHFAAVHRGAIFAERKTTEVRRLQPDSWGFFCPVHTPDGAPCGLISHFSSTCHLVTENQDISTVLPTLISLGMSLPQAEGLLADSKYLPVTLNGIVVGRVHEGQLKDLADKLRFLKAKEMRGLPRLLEIACIEPAVSGIGPFSGLFLFTTPARMMRPVRNLVTNSIEYIGTLEQGFLNIACADNEIQPGVHSHVELFPNALLSVVAQLTPFSDYNQSPRNMYQCQMCKQTMGTAMHSYPRRADNKIYRLQHVQAPLSRSKTQHEYGLNQYAHGCNAVVAVISYTGMDMEDAMIISKGSYERGFGQGFVYQTAEYNLNDERRPGEPANSVYFSNLLKESRSRAANAADNARHIDTLDDDGLPFVGSRVQQGDAILVSYNKTSDSFHVKKHKYLEPGFIEEVRILASDVGKARGDPNRLQRVSIKIRYDRKPVIGDKFASRAGQKGILGHIWPQQDMPFSESGIVPDVIINPNAFPSRMTIGMLIESMASKAGAMHGIFQECTPFQFSESNPAYKFFGQQLVKAGYNYYGNEPMYSGTVGVEFKADIYIGIVYYQRLRHMVKDKYQVRSLGPVNAITHQPLKGRKRGGGVRFGEMERDSILAHGVAFVLQDRLFHNSDESRAHVCRNCGSMVSTVGGGSIGMRADAIQRTCKFCEEKASVELVAVPFVFRYLVQELAAMNIRVSLGVK